MNYLTSDKNSVCKMDKILTTVEATISSEHGLITLLNTDNRDTMDAHILAIDKDSILVI